jgi:tRNA(fMet)-specific endonuclease VapC
MDWVFGNCGIAVGTAFHPTEHSIHFIFLDSPRVVLHAVDAGTVDFFASILNNLKAAGTPIPTNDIWIAAVAFQHGYKLYTKERHFDFVHGLIQF